MFRQGIVECGDVATAYVRILVKIDIQHGEVIAARPEFQELRYFALYTVCVVGNEVVKGFADFFPATLPRLFLFIGHFGYFIISQSRLRSFFLHFLNDGVGNRHNASHRFLNFSELPPIFSCAVSVDYAHLDCHKNHKACFYTVRQTGILVLYHFLVV